MRRVKECHEHTDDISLLLKSRRSSDKYDAEGVAWCDGVSSRVGIGRDRTKQDKTGQDRID